LLGLEQYKVKICVVTLSAIGVVEGVLKKIFTKKKLSVFRINYTIFGWKNKISKEKT
jgi:hypothetical protein